MNTEFRKVPELNPLPMSSSGAKVVACDLDLACVQVDCDALVDEIARVPPQTPDATEYVLHYCGVDYLDTPAARHGVGTPGK